MARFTGDGCEFPIGAHVRILHGGVETFGEVSSCTISGTNQCLVLRTLTDNPADSVMCMFNLSTVEAEVTEPSKKPPVPCE